MRMFVFHLKTLIRVALIVLPGMALADGVAYFYDALGRIIRADYANGAIIQYTYDTVGNRTSRTITPLNKPPVANAGADTTVNIRRKASLDGTASTDPDQVPNPLSYAWTQVSGPTVSLTNPTTSKPDFTPPVAGDYGFTLVVYDGKDYSPLSKPTTVHVPTNKPPVANAGSDQTVLKDSLVSLNGWASSDPDQGPDNLKLTWTQVGGPAVALTNAIVDPNSYSYWWYRPQTTFTAAQTGDYVFGLVVNDGLNDSPVSKVTVHVVINTPPVANAGPDTTANIGKTAYLDGTASADPDKLPNPLNYAWTQVSGPAVTLTYPTTAKPSFTPPEAGDYGFTVVVYDGKDYSPPSMPTTVHVSTNKPPVANAGTDQSVFVGKLASLDGTASRDPDQGPANLTYTWTQISGPAVTLSNPVTARPSFTPPKVGDYGFSLVVADGLNTSPVSTVTVHAVINTPPVADAGPDTTVNIRRMAYLNGSASLDPDQVPSPLTYAWKQVSGPAVTLNNPTTAKPSFTPLDAGDYGFTLVVYDGMDYSTPSTTTVHVPTNKPPVANAGLDQTAHVSQWVTLDGSASADPDNGPTTLGYTWTQISGPETVDLYDVKGVMPSFTPHALGDYVFGLVVNDGKDTSTQAKVTIHVVNKMPIANAGSDQTVISLQAVTLDGSSSYDPDYYYYDPYQSQNPLTYTWTQLSGPTVTLSSTTEVKPTFTPTTLGDYVFGLVVNDGNDASPQAKVTIHVANQVPVANAGVDQTRKTLQSVTLNGSASSDPD